MRVTLHLLGKEPNEDIRDISPYRVLSNNLILQAMDAGMPVKYLAFNDEADFFENLNSEKPKKSDVKIVKLRNNICHGNIMEFVNVELDFGTGIFTPEFLKPVTEQVLAISADWCEALGPFRKKMGLSYFERKASPP